MSAPSPTRVLPQTPTAHRSLIVLPMLSVLTLLVLLGSLESLARIFFTLSPTTYFPCFILNDPSTGVRAVPNSTCWQKTLEEPTLTEYKFNAAGHRAGTELTSKPPGTRRIVLIGSSMALGLRVPREKTFAALLPAQLSRRMGQPVELYNEAMFWGSPLSVVLRFQQVLKVEPDMVLWIVTPWDIRNVDLRIPEAETPSQGPHNQTFRQKIDDFVSRRARFVFVLKHFLYLSSSIYLQRFLQSSDAEFLKATPNPKSDQMRSFDRYAAEVIARCKAANIPLVAAPLPERAQAMLISSGDWPKGTDPLRFGREIRSSIEKYGGHYVDLLSAFREVPDAGSNYYPIDGHPTAEGQAIISTLLARHLPACLADIHLCGAQPPHLQHAE